MSRSSWYAAAALAALTFAATASAAPLHVSRDLDERITSVALNGDVHARVILPANYDDLPHRRYPVIYFLHGLPADSSAYRGNTWLADAMANVGPAILVLPQGARDQDTDPEYLNWGSGRNWENYIARELPHYIDAHEFQPPPEFQRAVMSCPPMRSMEYFKAILKCRLKPPAS